MAAEGSQDGDRTTRLPAGRKADLAAYVAEMGQVTVSALADRFAVSSDTIRRDLDQLDAEGLLIRTHGGAVSTTTLPRPDTGLDIRMRLQIRAKESIGALAAGLVEDGSSLMLNGGTTVLALVRHLRYHRQLTIATNNLRIPFEISPEIFRDGDQGHGPDPRTRAEEGARASKNRPRLVTGGEIGTLALPSRAKTRALPSTADVARRLPRTG